MIIKISSILSRNLEHQISLKLQCFNSFLLSYNHKFILDPFFRSLSIFFQIFFLYTTRNCPTRRLLFFTHLWILRGTQEKQSIMFPLEKLKCHEKRYKKKIIHESMKTCLEWILNPQTTEKFPCIGFWFFSLRLLLLMGEENE